MLKRLPLFVLGVIALIIHSMFPEMVPYSLDTIAGVLLILGFLIWTTVWIVTENQKTPAVERFDADEDGIKRAGAEINFLLEDGWDVKRIVDMVSANYHLTPKIVYEHVMDLIASNPQLQNQPPDEDIIRSSQTQRFSTETEIETENNNGFQIDTGKYRED